MSLKLALCLGLLGAPALAADQVPDHPEAERRCLAGELPGGRRAEVGVFETCVDPAGAPHPRRPHLTFEKAPAAVVLTVRAGHQCRQEWRPTPSCLRAWIDHAPAGAAAASARD